MLKKGLFASFLLTSLAGLSGCDLLGLDEEDAAPTPPPIVLPPELVVPEPLEPIPVPRVLFFKGNDFNDPENPVDFLYSFLISSKTLLKQSSGISATVLAQPIPLGRSRFSSGYVVMQENNHFYLGAADTDVLRQISTFDLPLCARDSFRLLSHGVGYVNAYVVAKTPGSDSVCDTVDDAFYRINLTATPTEDYQTATPTEYAGLPLHGKFWSLDGLFVQGESSIEIRKPDETTLRNFGALSNNTLTSPMRDGDQLILGVDGALYRNTSTVLASSEALTPLDTLDQATLTNSLSVVEGDALFTFDGPIFKKISLADGTSDIIANLDSVMTPIGRLQLSADFAFVKSSDNRLFKINRETGAYEVILSDLLGSFLISNERIFASVQVTGTLTQRAKFFAVDATPPLCIGESGVTVDENGCVSFARWVIADRYTENGITQLALLLTGKETITKERDNQGNEQTITHPPQINKFLNSPDLTVFDVASGLGQIALGAVNGYVSVNEIGTIELIHGLLAMTSYDETETSESPPDVYYFNINSSQSFKIVARTPQVTEALTALSNN